MNYQDKKNLGNIDFVEDAVCLDIQVLLVGNV